jgi:hypothetical protein
LIRSRGFASEASAYPFPEAPGAQSFSPFSVAGLAAWWDASATSSLFQNSDGTNPVTGAGQQVGSWRDISGANRLLTQSTSANRPYYEVAQIGTLPALDFRLSQSLVISGPVWSQPNTIFLVGRSDVPAATFQTFTDGATSTGRHCLRYASSIYLAQTSNPISGGVTDANAHVWCVKFNGATSELRIDGAVVATGNVGTHSLEGLTVGASYLLTGYLDGRLGEILLYNSAVSTIDAQRVEAYLRAKWGI